MKKKLEAKDVLTPWEEFLQKKREKKKQKKCESKQVRAWLADANGVFVGWNVPAFVSSSILTSLDVESTMLRCESCCSLICQIDFLNQFWKTEHQQFAE